MNAISYLNNTTNAVEPYPWDGSAQVFVSTLHATMRRDLGVAENLDAAKRSLQVAMRNANDGVAFIQTAESATAEVSNIVKRMRELAVQSASETLADAERSYIQDEFLQLTTEVDRIANVTNFNGVALSDGSSSVINVQVGIDNVAANDRISISLADLAGLDRWV